MNGCVHRSLVRSISPNSNLLPPLREVLADVADPAEEVVENEDDGLLTRMASCLLFMSKCWAHGISQCLTTEMCNLMNCVSNNGSSTRTCEGCLLERLRHRAKRRFSPKHYQSDLPTSAAGYAGRASVPRMRCTMCESQGKLEWRTRTIEHAELEPRKPSRER